MAYRSQQGLRNRSRTRFLAAATANIAARNLAKSAHRPSYRHFGGNSHNPINNSITDSVPALSVDEAISTRSVERQESQEIKQHQPRPSTRLTQATNQWEQSPQLAPDGEDLHNRWNQHEKWNEQSPTPLPPDFGRYACSPSYREQSNSPLESPIPNKYPSKTKKINFPPLMSSPTAEINQVELRLSGREYANQSLGVSPDRGECSMPLDPSDNEPVPLQWFPDIGQRKRLSQRPQHFFR